MIALTYVDPAMVNNALCVVLWLAYPVTQTVLYLNQRDRERAEHHHN